MCRRVGIGVGVAADRSADDGVDLGLRVINSLKQVSLVLNDEKLFGEWKQDIQTMAGRIIAMRKELHRLLTEELKTPGNWDHIVNQIGMFR